MTEARMPWEPGSTLVMYSDGLRSHFSLAAFGDLRSHDPTLIAAVLHRDIARGRDDATVVVLRDARAALP